MQRRTVLVLAATLLIAVSGCSSIPAPASPTTSSDGTTTATLTPTSIGTGAPADATTVTIVEVVDGDTMHIQYANGTADTIRLLGVDTPETKTDVDPAEFQGIPDTDAGRAWLRDWGHKASEFARSELAGQTVQITGDTQADRRGSYGRLLVYIYHDGELFNLQLLRQGYARMYDSQFSKRSQFSDAEETAQTNDVGLWGFASGTTATPATDGGGQLIVADIHADAAGNDNENLNGEYLVFENTGDTSLDLSGWTVSDAAGHTYTFPAGVTLATGQQLTLYTGSGDDTDTELYWGSERAIWNNGGDTIIVKNDTGSVTLEESY